jgi:Xaa-Pro dipeptidase
MLNRAASLASLRRPLGSKLQHATRFLSRLFTMDVERVLQGKYPAKAHAKRVTSLIRERVPNASGVLYLEGRMTKLIEDNDEPEPFRQRRYFFYLTGCELADSYLVYDMDADRSTLFIPPLNPDSVIWSGLPVSAAEALEMYDVDEVKYANEVNVTLAHVGAREGSTVFAIPNQVSTHVSFLEFDDKNFGVLKEAIETARVVKDEYELALMQKANGISSAAHKTVMERVGHSDNEQQLEAAFVACSIAAGAKHQSYHPISAAGRSAATLHYVRNDQTLRGKLNLLLDAGAEWKCYASDIVSRGPIGADNADVSDPDLPNLGQVLEGVSRNLRRCAPDAARVHRDVEGRRPLGRRAPPRARGCG